MLAPYMNLQGKDFHPAYSELNQLGVLDADKFYKEFNSRNKSSEVLERYLKKLEPKNFWDKIFYGAFYDSRITKKAAVERILMDRKEI